MNDSSAMKRVAVIGANAAGTAAITCLRRLGYDGVVDLFDADEYGNYERPSFSKRVLLSTVEPSTLALSSVDALGPKTNIHHKRIAHLDSNRLVLSCTDGEKWNADAILIATGSSAADFNIPTDGSIPLYTLRTWTDALHLSKAIVGARILIIGGGVIGCEVAAATASRSKHTHLVEISDQLMARAFDHRIGRDALPFLRALGIKITLSARLIEIADGAAVLSDGTRVEYDLVLAGVGSTPNIELAEESGIDCDAGILVDGRQGTSAPNIFAAGDVAEGPFGWNGTMTRHEAQISAQNQGEAAAHAMIGKSYPPWTPFFWSDQADRHYAQIGWRPETSVTETRTTGDGQLLFHHSEDRLAGATAINAQKDLPAVRRLICASLDQLDGLNDPDIPLREIVRGLTTAA